jgi:hypothetical protein
MAKKTQFSDEEKAEALAALDANGGNVARTARDLGIPRSTIRDWVKGRGVNPAVAEIRQEKKDELAQRFEAITFKLMGLVDADLGKLSPRDKWMALGIATDKWLLLNDMPTGIQKITGFEDLSDADLDDLID